MTIRHVTLHDVVQHCHRLAQQGQRLRPEQSPIAAFDADGTLWGPDVAELLWKRLLSKKALDRRATAPIARALRNCGCEPTRNPYLDYASLENLYREGRCPEETMVRVMLQGLAGMKEEDVYLHSAAAISSAKELQELGASGPRQVVEKLRAQGFRVIVVSSSPRWTVEVAARPLGLEPRDILAGQVAVVEGALTDGVIEPLPYGKGKVQAILRRFGAVPRVSLGNGLGDLSMMEATSDLRILVNPSDELLLACEEIRGATWSVVGLAETLPVRGKRTGRAGKVAVAQAGGQASAKLSHRPGAQT